jgi:hypothetical protein
MVVFQIRGPWTDAERADLERVGYLLRARGLADEVGGLTDHGDPWVAFCDADGRVLLHVARIGRTYHHDGLGIAKPRVVRRLEDVIGALQSSRPAEAPAPRSIPWPAA